MFVCGAKIMGTTRRLCTMVIRVYWPYGMAIRHGHDVTQCGHPSTQDKQCMDGGTLCDRQPSTGKDWVLWRVFVIYGPLFTVRPSVLYDDSQKNRQEMVGLYQDYMTDHTVYDPPIMMCWINSNMIIKTLFKITYSLMATGLLAGAPVDAQCHKKKNNHSLLSLLAKGAGGLSRARAW